MYAMTRLKIRRFLAVLAVVVTGTSLTAVPSSPASAALPACTGASKVYLFWGVYAMVPTTQTGSGNMNCTLRWNDYYSGVSYLEANSLSGCHGADIHADLYYGSATEDIIRWGQAAHGITADGIYGPQTRRFAVKFGVYDHWTNYPLLHPDGRWRCEYVRG
jgi:peptidoglycan hydrolase-like protein with peptidoglycan-binding domain